MAGQEIPLIDVQHVNLEQNVSNTLIKVTLGVKAVAPKVAGV